MTKGPLRRALRRCGPRRARQHGRVPGRDRAVREGSLAGARGGPGSGHGAVHGHRRIDAAGIGPRRPLLGGAPLCPPCASCGASWSGSAARRSIPPARLLRHVRRAGMCCACAVAVRDAVRPLDLEIRAGLHTGELEFVDGATRELAVNIGQRVLAEAGAGEVLVSSTVEGPRGRVGARFRRARPARAEGAPEEWSSFRYWPDPRPSRLEGTRLGEATADERAESFLLPAPQGR